VKVQVSQADDALYFELDDVEVMESEEVQPGVIMDYDATGRLVGIEIVNLSARIAPEKLRLMQFETT